MLKTAAAITGVCVIYFCIGACATAGCYLGAIAAERLVEKFESKEE